VNASHFSVGFVCRQKPNVLDRALAFYTDAQRFGAWRSWRFLPLNFIRRTNAQIYVKLSYEALNRQFCQTPVMPSPFFFYRLF